MNKVALVTGGSAGLGAKIARGLDDRGWCVWAGSRRAKSPAEGIRGIALDVADPASVHAAVAEILERAGRLDAVVCNAGVNVSAPAEELPEPLARTILETNLWGAINVIRAAMPALRESRGRIVAIGSLAGMVSPPGEAYYAASKHALRGFLESLRYEVDPQGVRVALVAPGFIRTDLPKTASQHDWPRIACYDGLRDHLARHWQEAIAGGMAPEAVARLVVDIVQKCDPPFRTRIGTAAVWVPRLKAVLPAPLFFRILAWKFGIGGR